MTEENKAPAGSGFWQIIFPAILGVLLVVFLAVWTVIEISPGNVSRFAEISTVLLVIPVLGGSLLGALVLVGLTVLTVKIIQGLPKLTAKVLEILDQIQTVIKRISEYAVAPVIRPAALLAGLVGIFKKKDPEIQID